MPPGLVREPELEVTLVVDAPDSEPSLELQRAFFADIADRYPGWEPASSRSVEPGELVPPDGVWLVAYLDGDAVGCGGLQRHDSETAEIRRLYLDERARRRGIGRALLARLEREAQQFGYRSVRLTTGDTQPEALGLFKSAGFEEIPPFSDGVFTRHWLEKELIGIQGG